MKKILFLIHDLGQGGAEKVLVNLVNHLDRSKYKITVLSLFGGGVNERFLAKDITYRAVYPRGIPANSIWMKALSPEQLHRRYIRGRYDVEIAFLEGPSARIISGCPDPSVQKLVWIHSTIRSLTELGRSFRSVNEALACYRRFDRVVCVSEDIRKELRRFMALPDACVIHNPVHVEEILRKAEEPVDTAPGDGRIRLVTAGSLKPVKGYDRLLRIADRLKREGYAFHLQILGKGELREMLQCFIRTHDLEDCVELSGYHTNPYKYVKNSDIYVCSSLSEGFSTAVTEALVAGTAVISTDVSGMRELLGEHDEYGIVTENNEEALYLGLKELLDFPEKILQYRYKAAERGRQFGLDESIEAIDSLITGLEGSKE